jgi:hypothetical protein
MFTWGVTAESADEDRPVRRVREEVRDGAAVVAVSAAASTAVALFAMLLMKLAG